MNDYVSFQSFHSEEEASSLAEIFSKNNIDCTIVKAKPIIDSVIIGEDAEDKIYLKIKNSDFKKANEVLQKQIECRTRARKCGARVCYARKRIHQRREARAVAHLQFRASEKIVNTSFELKVLRGCSAGRIAGGNWARA